MYRKLLSNLPLMLLITMILLPLLICFPATVVRYEITSANSQSKSFGEGLTWFSDELGMNALPCSGFGFTVSFPRILSGSTAQAFRVWQSIGKFGGQGMLGLGGVHVMRYLARKKVRPRNFFLIVVAYFGFMLLMFWVSSQKQLPECSPEDSFQLVSFMPYWPMIVLMVVTIFGMLRNYVLLDRFEKQELAFG